MKALWTLLAVSIITPNPTLAQEVNNKQPPPSVSGTRTVEGGQFTGNRIRGSAWVGETAPGFELAASTGESIRISQYRGSWVLLIFAERKEHFAAFNEIESDMRESGITMVGVCDEKPHHLLSYARKGLTAFPLLGDVKNEVSAVYGLYDPLSGVIQPGFFVIDGEGIVQMSLIGRQIPGADMASLARYASVRGPR